MLDGEGERGGEGGVSEIGGGVGRVRVMGEGKGCRVEEKMGWKLGMGGGEG